MVTDTSSLGATGAGDSIDDLFSALQNGVVAINELTSLAVSTSAVSLDTFDPSVARAMLVVTTSSDGVYYIPMY